MAPLRRTVGWVLAMGLLVGGISACGPAASTLTPGPETETLNLQVLVRDGAMRTIDAECAGASPFLYIHKDGPYWVEDASEGSPVLAGRLPAGVAEPAIEGGLGIPRQPAFCRFSWEVSLEPGGQYRLRLEEGEPVPFDLKTLDAERRITVVVP